MFPEGENEGLYHTADATLWFFHALDRYLRATGDRDDAARCCCRRCVDIVEHHLRGTRFGIGVDPADGLLRAGRRGLPAHLDGRQGRRLGRHAAARQGGRDQRALVQRAPPAGRLAARGARRRGRASRSPAHAERARASFNARFWYDDGRLPLRRRRRRAAATTPACRPNQLFAISLAAPGARPRALGSRCCDVVARAAADAGRPALARARAPRLQAAATTATCARATPPTTRGRSGPG